jgi:hypothetical protein
VHGVWLSYYRHPAAGLKQKNPPPYGSGFGKSGENSKPVRRAGQQRARKQQVQVLVHVPTLVPLSPTVKFSVGGVGMEELRHRQTPNPTAYNLQRTL